VIESEGESYLVPLADLAGYKIPVAEIVPAILRSMGVGADELNSADLDETLASWKNPVVAFLPDQPS